MSLHLKRLAPLLLLVALVLAGCGSTRVVTHTVTTRAPQAQPGEAVVPVHRIVIRESAARPDGYSPASPPLVPKLFGSSIHVSAHGARFIEGFEGFSSCPYWDPYGSVATRGYGETEGISMGSGCISRSFGERNLIYRLERFYGWAVRGLGVSLNQNQADALYSFAWNLGAGIFRGSLRYSLQHHNPYPLLGYDHAGGQVLSGLARRRRAEVALYLTPAHEETPAQRRARIHRERVARLHRDYRARRALDGVLAHEHCLHGYRHFSRRHMRRCNVWRGRHAAVNRDIKALHRLGIR